MTTSGYELEQGPRWLADFLYAPPEWLPFALVLVLLTGGVVVVWLAARADIDAEALSEIATNVSILVVTYLVTDAIAPLWLPYLADVVIGAATGILTGFYVVGPLVSRVLDDGLVGYVDGLASHD